MKNIFEFCKDMNKVFKNYDVEFVADKDDVEDSVTVLVDAKNPKIVAEYFYNNHFKGAKDTNVGVDGNKVMLVFYNFSEYSTDEIERLVSDAIFDANARYNLFENKENKTMKKSLKESLDKDTLFAIDGDISVYEDSYEEGEGKHVQTYELDIKGKYSLKELMKQLSYYGYSENPKDYYFSDVNGYSSIESDCTQNENGEEPSKSEVESWKKGEITLYNAHLFAHIYEIGVHDVSHEDAKEIGFDM